MGLVITFALGAFIVIGAAIAHFTKHTHRVEQISVSIALGAMTGLSVLELIPESIKSVQQLNKGIWVTIFVILTAAAAGVGVMKALDAFIPEHDHAHGFDHHCSEQNTMHVGIMATAAVILHNIIEGMAVYSVSKSALQSGIMIAIGVGLHNIPMGMMIYSTLHHESQVKKWAILAGLSLSTLIGGLLMHFLWFLFPDYVVGVLISLTLGMLVYIVFFELLPHILHGKKKGLSFLCALGGFLLVLAGSFLE